MPVILAGNAQAFVRGPTHMYAGVGSQGAPIYLGTAERSPRISVRPAFSPYWNDIAGQKVPYDWGFDGEEAFVVADLTRWNQSTLLAMQARPRGTLSTPGKTVTGEIGTLMNTEGFSIPFWLQFTYQNKAAYATQPPGYRFAAGWLIGPDDLDNNNTGAARVRAVWYCSRQGTVNVPAAGMDYTLYDFNMSGLPPIS